MAIDKILKKYLALILLICKKVWLALFLEIKNITIPYQTVICFFLISIIGVSHGALDHVKGSQLMKIYKVKNNFYFYLVYIFFSLLVILCWTILPLFTLIIFLFVASYHFGKEDSSVGLINNRGFKNILYLFKGSLIVVAPLFFHQEETLKIFQSLLACKLLYNQYWIHTTDFFGL